MKRARLMGLPVFLLVLVCNWLVYDGLRAKYQTNAEYAMPADKSPPAMLDFLRKMDGSMEFSQGLLMRGDNADEVCKAVLDACEYIPANSPDLTLAEQREIEHYRVKYLGGAIARGIRPGTQATIDELADFTKNLISSADVFGFQEQSAAEMTLRVLEGKESNNETRGFIAWLLDKLSTMKSSSEKDAFVSRLERIATRLEMTHSQMVLQSLTLDEQAFDIQSLRGQIVLVEFWGTRCQPCLKDLPALKRIYAKYRDRGFQIVGICLNAEPERIRRFAAEHELPWVQLCHDHSLSMDCNKSLAERFGIEAVPTTLLIDANGQVLSQGIRPFHSDQEKDLEKQLEKLLKHR